jgi:DHA3 family macrolide efflux protein-like MFS transporter
MVMFQRAALKNKSYRYHLISQVTSILSVCIVNYLLVLKIFQETGSSYSVTLLWLAYSIPVLFVGPFASTVVDLVNKRTLLIITNLLQAFTILLYIPVSHKFMLMYTIAFVYSLLNQFYLPAESAFIPTLFKREDLPQVNGTFYLTKQAATFLGYALAGFLFKFIGFNISLVFCGILGFIAFVSVLGLPSTKPSRKLDLENQLSGFLKEVINGYKYISANKSILFPLIFVSGLEITATIIALNIPVMAQQLFRLKIEDAAILVVTPALLGTVAGVIQLPKLMKRKIRKIVFIKYSLIVAAICMVSFMFVGYLPHTARFIFIPIISLCLGVAFIGAEVPTQTFIQESTPKDMLGRIFGNIWFLVTLATIIPLTLSASITELIGARGLIAFLALASIVSLSFIGKLFRQMEPIDSLVSRD